jgi:hypothetical protein
MESPHPAPGRGHLFGMEGEKPDTVGLFLGLIYQVNRARL